MGHLECMCRVTKSHVYHLLVVSVYKTFEGEKAQSHVKPPGNHYTGHNYRTRESTKNGFVTHCESVVSTEREF